MLVRWLLTGRSTGRREQRAAGRVRSTEPVEFADLGCAARESLAVARTVDRRLEVVPSGSTNRISRRSRTLLIEFCGSLVELLAQFLFDRSQLIDLVEFLLQHLIDRLERAVRAIQLLQQRETRVFDFLKSVQSRPRVPLTFTEGGGAVRRLLTSILGSNLSSRFKWLHSSSTARIRA